MDLISREAAIEWFTRKENEFAEKHPTGMRLKFAEGIARALANIPAADAVSRGLFEQIKWERDIAMEQLTEHGIAFGAKSDPARLRPKGEWSTGYYVENGRYVWDCSNCCLPNDNLTDFCPNCGADMRGEPHDR